MSRTYMTSSTVDCLMVVFVPSSTSITVPTSFQAWTNVAAVAWRKRSCDTILVWPRRGWTYSPIYQRSAPLPRKRIIRIALTTSFATLSQNESMTRAPMGNTLTALLASIRKASKTWVMKASIGVKSSWRTMAPVGVCALLPVQIVSRRRWPDPF